MNQIGDFFPVKSMKKPKVFINFKSFKVLFSSKLV